MSAFLVSPIMRRRPVSQEGWRGSRERGSAVEVRELIARLPQGAVGPLCDSEPGAHVRGVELVKRAQDMTRSDILYLLPATEPLDLAPEHPVLSCVLVGPASMAPGAVAPGRLNLLRSRPTTDPHELCEWLQDLLATDDAVCRATERLVATLTSDQGLQHLVEEASAVLGNPLAVVDPSYHYIARAGFEVSPKDSSAFARIMREELRYGTILEEGVGYISEAGIDDELARSRGAVAHHNDLLGMDTLIQQVTVHGVCLARVVMLAHNQALGPAERQVFSRFAALVGQELQKSEIFTTSSTQMGSYFLGRLLDDEHPIASTTQRRLKILGFRPLPALFMIALRPRTGTLHARTTTSVEQQLQPMLAHSLVTLHEGSLVVLVSREKGPSLTSLDKRTLHAVATTNNLLVGVSNAFVDICEARRYLSQALAAAHYGSSFTKILDDDGVYHFHEYDYVEMLDLCSERKNLFDYCHPAIETLWRHDNEHDSELVETLFAYLQNGGNTARTALLLSIHKNTLLYRLGRIHEITHNDLTSGEDLFLFQLSIRVLIFLGLFEPRVRPRTSQDLRAGPRGERAGR